MPVPKKLLAGVDEVGRGPLAGPVVTAAVILSPDDPMLGQKKNDSSNTIIFVAMP